MTDHGGRLYGVPRTQVAGEPARTKRALTAQPEAEGTAAWPRQSPTHSTFPPVPFLTTRLARACGTWPSACRRPSLGVAWERGDEPRMEHGFVRC